MKKRNSESKKQGNQAKITCPRPEGLLLRQRLFERLDAAWMKYPLIWVSGPAGSGKTSLLSSFIGEREISCLWYQLDEGDADLSSFFYFMGLAARRVSRSKRRRHLPLFTPEYALGAIRFSSNFFQALYGMLPASSLLVFDNFEKIGVEDPLHRILLHCLPQMPAGTSMVILSRTPPGPSFARLAANRQMTVLDWQDLKLSWDEAENIVKTKLGEKADQKRLDRLYRMVDGWPAGLHLLLEADPAEAPASFFGIGKHEVLFDYFANEIFDNLDFDLKDLLLKTCFMPHLSVAMAEQLTGYANAASKLAFLHRNNHFTEKRHGQPVIYQYHLLFQKFLLEKAKEHLSPHEHVSLLRKGAELLLGANEPDKAADLFIFARDWQGLEDLIIKQAKYFLNQGRNITLLRLLHAFPPNYLKNSPWLLYWMGIANTPIDPAESRKYLENAFHLFRKDGNQEEILLSWSHLIDAIIYQYDDFRPLSSQIKWLDAYIAKTKPILSSEVEIEMAKSMTAALMICRPDHEQCDYWMERTLQLASQIQDPGQKTKALSYVLNYYNWMGDHQKALPILKEIKQMAHFGHSVPVLQLSWRWMEAGFYTVSGIYSSPQASLGIVEEALQLAEKKGIFIFNHILFSTAVFACLLQEDFSGAEHYLQRLHEIQSPGRRHGYCQYHYLAGWYHFLKGEDHLAQYHAGEALDLAESTGFFSPVILCLLENSHVAMKLHQLDRAGELIDRGLAMSRQTRNSMMEYMSLSAKAQNLLRSKKADEGLACLRQAFGLGRKREYFSMIYWWHKASMAELCAAALENAIESEYAIAMIKKYDLTPEHPPIEIENWPWPFKVYTLGRFEIVKDDQPLRLTSRAQQKPLLLLKILIALGGRRIYEGHITELLWPEVDGDLQHQNFRTTLHRLRKLLALPKAVLYHEGQFTLDSHYCWVDIWAFERLATRATQARQDEPEKAVAVSRRSLRLYKGRFMQLEENAGWLLPVRERLHNRFLGQVEELGSFYRSNGEWRQAIDLYWQALAVDPLIESFYQAIITCHLATGNRAEAARVHASCRETFRKLLGIEPSLPALQDFPLPPGSFAN